MPRAPSRHGTVRFMRADSSTSTSAPARPEGQDAPADHAEGGGRRATAGHSFLNVNDSEEMRIILIVRARATRSWEEAFRAWSDGFPYFRAGNRAMHREKRLGALHAEVAERLLSPANRRHIKPDREIEYCSTADGGVFMRIGMLEALRVEQREDADTSVMIVVHAIVPNPDYRAFHRFFHDAAEQEHFETTLNRLLLEACGDNSCPLVLDHSRRTGNRSDSIFMISWLPGSRLDALSSAGNGAMTPGAFSEQHGVAVGSDVIDAIRKEDVTSGSVGRRRGSAAMTVAGWAWAWRPFPFPDGVELTGARFQEVAEATHELSQSWSVTLSECGAAYMPRQDDNFGGHARLAMCTTHLDVYLLILLDRIRVRELSRSLGVVAKGLRAATHNLGPHVSRQGLIDLEAAIDEAIALDSEAVLFLAAEWWADVTDNELGDRILRWMQAIGGLDEAVEQVVSQAHLLRESVQNLLERQEQRLEAERQASTRVMEKALAVLTFIGMPLTVLLELWVNWDPASPLAQRGWLAWLLFALVVCCGSVSLGWVIARVFFKINLVRLFSER